VNALDYALLALVALSALAAAARGLVYELWMMAAAVAAVLVAAWEYRAAADWLTWIGDPEARRFAAFALIVALALAIAAAVGRMVRGAVRAVGLGWLDRLLGAGLGVARGLLLGIALVAVLTAFPVDTSLIQGSRFAPGFLWASRGLAWVMPQELSQRFDAGLAEIRQKLP
jgi:membrane protein required for colicin V production